MRLIRPGDIVLFTLAALMCGLLAWQLWAEAPARSVLIRQNGKLWREVSLLHNQTLRVPGPLGDTVVRIADGRARIERDPSPRQYCVRQGWLTHAGQMSICLPNATSIELAGGASRYDSLSF